MAEKKKAKARWYLDLVVDCPYCDNTFDVLNEFNYQEIHTMCNVCESVQLGEEFEVECQECKKEFFISETEY